MDTPAANVFISYSHYDASLVAPVVSLLRVSRALVFRDADSIPPGKKWRGEIESAIDNAHVLVVFWCHHAKDSDEVAIEYRRAIAQGKDVVPLRLDDAPLPPDLDDYQFIDFRGIPGFRHEAAAVMAEPPPETPSGVSTTKPPLPPAAPPPAASKSSSPGLAMLIGVGVAVALVAGIAVMMSGTLREAPPLPGGTVELAMFDFAAAPLLGAAAVLGGLLWAGLKFLRRRRAAPSPQDKWMPVDVRPPDYSTLQAHRIASTIEAAVLERIERQYSRR